MSPERRAANQEAAERMLAELPLAQLRAARKLTQAQLAISKLERRADMYVTTLARFIEAMGC